MPINISHGLGKDDSERLAGILKCKVNDLDSTLASYASAALQEYVRMFLGQRVFTRGSDMREYRLLLLIQYAFDKRVPDEQKISDLFQTTASQSRALLRAVMSKYQYELSSAIRATITDTLKSATQAEDGADYEFTVNNENVIEAMNRALASLPGTWPQVTRKTGTVSTYVIRPSSHDRLVEHYQIK
jgi:hypothetical protein